MTFTFPHRKFRGTGKCSVPSASGSSIAVIVLITTILYQIADRVKPWRAATGPQAGRGAGAHLADERLASAEPQQPDVREGGEAKAGDRAGEVRAAAA